MKLFVLAVACVIRACKGLLTVSHHNQVGVGRPSKLALTTLFAKTNATVCLSDFGLGGLSIFSDFAEHIKRVPLFARTRVVYINAAYQKDYFKTITNLNPDILLIACNSMSVQWEQSNYFAQVPFPVLSMVPIGVELFSKSMNNDVDSPVLLVFSTETVAKAAVYAQRLSEAHAVAQHRIVTQDCGDLHALIEAHGPQHTIVETKIEECVHAAWQQMLSLKLARITSIYAGMACTHYGWASRLWMKAMRNEASGQEGLNLKILDPNHDMASYLFDSRDSRKSLRKSETSLEIESTPISGNTIAHIAPLLENEAAIAFRHIGLAVPLYGRTS